MLDESRIVGTYDGFDKGVHLLVHTRIRGGENPRDRKERIQRSFNALVTAHRQAGTGVSLAEYLVYRFDRTSHLSLAFLFTAVNHQIVLSFDRRRSIPMEFDLPTASGNTNNLRTMLASADGKGSLANVHQVQRLADKLHGSYTRVGDSSSVEYPHLGGVNDTALSIKFDKRPGNWLADSRSGGTNDIPYRLNRHQLAGGVTKILRDRGLSPVALIVSVSPAAGDGLAARGNVYNPVKLH